MSETTVERPLADLATLQKQLEELAARARSSDTAARERADAAKPELANWLK
jgi:hypothetical protein